MEGSNLTGGEPTGATLSDDTWRANVVTDRAGLTRILDETKRIAVLGIKPIETGQPAFHVPEYAQRAGYEIVPVPVYYPDATEVLGEPVVRELAKVTPPADMINVFRRSADLPQHVGDFLAAKPRVVWFQLGIRNDAVAETLAKAGIQVVQDRCLLVELQARGK